MASEDCINPADDVSSSDDELQQSLFVEDSFVCELINTIPSSCYFDQDARNQLAEFKHESTNLKIIHAAGNFYFQFHCNLKKKSFLSYSLTCR